MRGKLIFPDSPISPFADDLFLIEPDPTTSAALGDGGTSDEDLLLKSRNLLATQFLSSIRKRSNKAKTDTVDVATVPATVDARQQQDTPPPTAFLTVATITIQLSMLRQLSQSESTAALACATCEGLLAMLEPMPIPSLRNLSTWEANALLQISDVMHDIAKASPRLSDSVKSLLLSFAIHRASLASILQVLETISTQQEFVCAQQTISLVKRMCALQQHSWLAVEWKRFEKRFPVRHASLATPSPTATPRYYSMAPSPDSSAIYLATLTEVIKIGSGDSRVLGSNKQLIPGKVYATLKDGGGFVFTLQSKLFTASRSLGSNLIHLIQRDLDTLQPVGGADSGATIAFKDTNQVDSESVLMLSGNDDKGGQTIAWASPCGAWTVKKSCYFEVTVRSCESGGTLCVGWHSPQFNSADNLRLGGGGDEHCWGVDVLSNEVFMGGSKTTKFGWKLGKFECGDVLGCAMEISPDDTTATLSFANNGVWWLDAFQVPFAKARPLISYSCADETLAPQWNFGGNVGFKHLPPSSNALGFVPQCHAMEAGDTVPASLPVLASNGHFLYAASFTASSTLVVDTFALLETNTFALRETQTFANVPFNANEVVSLVVNGCGDMILVGKGGRQQYALREGKTLLLPEVNMAEQVDALTFDPQLNLVWAWNLGENCIFAFENKALGCCPLPAAASVDTSTTFDACELIVTSLARLAWPYASVQVPRNGNHSYCAICHDKDLTACDFRDMFIDPFHPTTFTSFARILEFALQQQPVKLQLVESLLTLLYVNLHVACCGNKQSKVERGDWTDLLKQCLIKITCTADTLAGSIVRLAERSLVDGVPLFWPMVEDKIACNVDNPIVADAVLVALNIQLVDTCSFAMHRDIVNNSEVQRMLKLQDGPLAQAASSLLISLLACGFNYAMDVDNPSLAVVEEEESKEDSKPTDPFDDVVYLSMQILEHCIATRFTTAVARKVLPMVLVCLDNLVLEESTRTHAIKSLLQSEFSRMLARVSKGIVSELKPDVGDVMHSSSSFTFTKLEVMSSTIESRMFTADADGVFKLAVNVPYASQLQITFLPRALDLQQGEVLTFKSGDTVVLPALDSLPGITPDIPPLIFTNQEGFECSYLNKDSKFTFRVTANRLVRCKSLNRDWSFHLFDATKRLLSTVVHATTGSSAFALTHKETTLIRWVQNPLFSGGLKFSEEPSNAQPFAMTPLFTPRTLRNAASRTSLNAHSLQEDADRLVDELLKVNSETTFSIGNSASLASGLVLGMRQPSNRVPLDAGRLTQPAVCAVIAAMIRTNGLEPEAVTFARSVLESHPVTVQAPLRLRTIWSAAQLIRAWADSLIVNGRVDRHFEACGVANINNTMAAAATEMNDVEKDKTDEDGFDGFGGDDDEREEREYAKLCQLVQSRCELVAQTLSPPPFLHQPMRRREVSKARWHYVREYYCPKTSRMLGSDPLTCVLRGALAWSKALAPSVSQFSAAPATSAATRRRDRFVSSEDVFARSPLATASTIEVHTSRKASLSSFVPSSLDNGVLLSPPPARNTPLERRSSLASWGGPTSRIQSWIVAKDATSMGGPTPPATPLARKASIILESGVRASSRVEGGLRRAPVQDEDFTNSAQVEHEQTLSESVLNFVQSATVLRKRDIIAALRSRNERAQARVQGLVIAINIAQETDFRSKPARAMFEAVLHNTIAALSSDSSMEDHFLTDLAGCSVVWRERVSHMFLALLRIVCQHATRVARNYVFLPQAKAVDHLKCLLDGMQLDYVESDYSLLYRANVFDALCASLRIPALETKAFHLFERLFRRCVIDHHFAGGNSVAGGAPVAAAAGTVTVGEAQVAVGTIWHQQLMDVLVGGICTFWSASYDQEELEFSDSDCDESVAGDHKNQISFTRKEIILCHQASQFLSKQLQFATTDTFSLTCTVRRSNGNIIGGTLLTVNGTVCTLQLCIDENSSIALCINNAATLKLKSSAKLVRWTKLCLLVENNNTVHLYANQNDDVFTHDSFALPAGGQWTGNLYIGSDQTGSLACQGVVVCDIMIQQDELLSTVQFFGDAVDIKEQAFEPLVSSIIATKQNSSSDKQQHSQVLSCLDLANTALKYSCSSIALARLSTPDTQSVLLQLVLDARCPLSVRVSTARVLKRVLSIQPANQHKLDQLCSCISYAMPPSARPVTVLIADPKSSATMAQVVIDLIFYLCEASQEWTALVVKWIASKLSGLRRCLYSAGGSGTMHFTLPEDERDLRQAFTAISLCGGRIDFLRLGGKAMVNTEEELVHIVSQSSSASVSSTERDISAESIISMLKPSNDGGGAFGGFLITAPADYTITRVEIRSDANSHETIRHARIRVAESASQLTRAMAQEIQIDPTSSTFELKFTEDDKQGGEDTADKKNTSIQFVQADVDTVWGGNASQFHVKAIQVFGQQTAAASAAQQQPELQQFICRPVTTVDDTADDGKDPRTSPTMAYSANQLVPHSRIVPKSIVEQLVTEHNAMDRFEEILLALHEYVSAQASSDRVLVALDLFTRLLKAVCTVVPTLAQLGVFVSPEMAHFLCTLAKTQHTKLSPVPSTAKFKRNQAPEHWNVTFTTKAGGGEDIVRFEPMQTAAPGGFWPHRVALVDTSASQFSTSGGVHSWTFTLVQDGVVRGDESVLFGLCSSNVDFTDALDVLAPSSRFRLLRAFDGSAIGEAPPSPMLCVRVGDSLCCEWDVTAGTLSMAVNNRPFVCVFTGLQGRDWQPCVATYAERGAEVVIALNHVLCTPTQPKRRCMYECQGMSIVQIESLAQCALQAMMLRGEDQVGIPPTRSLTFKLAQEDDGDDDGNGEDFGGLIYASSSDDDEGEEEGGELNKARVSTMPSRGSTTASLYNPALCGVEDTTASSHAQQSVEGGAATLKPSSSALLSFSPRKPLASSNTVAAMTNAERYLALLWELTARLSSEGFDSIVQYWPHGVELRNMRWTEVEETVSSLHRVHLAITMPTANNSSNKPELELLNVLDTNRILAYAAKRIVALGNNVLDAKQKLKRRKPPAVGIKQ